MKRNTWRKSLALVLTAVLCMLSWAGAEEPADNTTGFGIGKVYSVRKKDDGGYGLWIGDSLVGELPETEELIGLIGEEELILLTAENVSGVGSDLTWVQEYLQGENLTGTGSESGVGIGGGAGAVYVVRKMDDGGYGLWIGDSLVGELPETEELIGLIGEEELILLTAENVSGVGSDLAWVQEYLQGENLTGTGSESGVGIGGGAGAVYVVRKKDDGGYGLWIGDSLVGELPETEELFGLIGEEELILLTAENVSGVGSDLAWVQEYLQGENLTGTGSESGVGIGGGAGAVYVVRKKDDGVYGLWIGDSLVGELPETEELMGLIGEEELILLTAENVSGVGSDLAWVQEYLRGENLTGTGSESGVGIGGGAGAVYVVRKKDDGGYGLWIGDSLVGELPETEELIGLIGEEELILLTAENVSGVGSDLAWVQEYLQGENLTGTGSESGVGIGGGAGAVYVVRKKDDGVYGLWIGDSLVGELPETEELFGLIGEEELILLTAENVSGVGSDLAWVQEYLQGENLTGTGSESGVGIGGGAGAVYVVRKKDDGEYGLWIGDSLVGELPETEELIGLIGEEELILLTAENVSGVGSDLAWVQEYLQGENLTGTGSESGVGIGGGAGAVYIIRKKDDGGYGLWIGDSLVGELPETEELMGLIGEEELILLTAENVSGVGSDLAWVQEYLHGENLTGTGTGTGDVVDYGNKPTKLEELLNQTVPENSIYVQDNLGSGI